MIGPVFDLEWSRGNQRRRLDVLRRIYSFLLLFQLLALSRGDGQTLHQFAQRWLEWFLPQQLVGIALATPVFLAGGIGDEKARGSLQFLLTSDLTSWEIVVGKCLGRLSQLAVLFSVGLPLLCLLAPLSGFSLAVLLLLVAFTLAFLLALSGASVLAAVWARHTRDAVLALYLVGALLIVAGWGMQRWAAGPAPLLRVLKHFDLVHVLAPMGHDPDPRELGVRLRGACLAWSLLGATCLGLAALRLRGAYRRQLESRPRTGRWLQRPPPGDDALRWKEAQVERPVPIPVLGAVPGWLGMAILLGALVVWSGYALRSKMDRRLLVLEQSLGVVFFASLIVGIRASGAVTREREHNTWETLLTTPLETAELLRGKLHGILDAMTPFLFAYALFATMPALVAADLVAGGLTLLAIPVVWLAMYLLGAAGILASARAASSGQSLINTLVTGYAPRNLQGCLHGSHGVFLSTSILFGCVLAYTLATGGGWQLEAVIALVGLLVSLSLGPGLALWYRAQEFMESAAIHIDRRERVKQRREDRIGGPFLH